MKRQAWAAAGLACTALLLGACSKEAAVSPAASGSAAGGSGASAGGANSTPNSAVGQRP